PPPPPFPTTLSSSLPPPPSSSPPSPPPPPPPSPPPPPPFQDFPHSCYPGNSAINGGVGSGTGDAAYAWEVTLTSTPGTSVGTINIAPNPTCEIQYGCCAVNLEKVEFVLNPICRNTIVSQTGTSLLPSYSTQTWPGTPPPPYTQGELLTVGKFTGMCPPSSTGAACNQSYQVTFNLNPSNSNCNTTDKFFLNGAFWWAAYGSTAGASNNCCGTNGNRPLFL
ncbi:hypothetical protein CEUSTIGMA_g2032.t1, partial [Chlamydomonas eustigma]